MVQGKKGDARRWVLLKGIESVAVTEHFSEPDGGTRKGCYI